MIKLNMKVIIMNIHGVTGKKKDHDGAIVVLFGMGASYLRLHAAHSASGSNDLRSRRRGVLFDHLSVRPMHPLYDPGRIAAMQVCHCNSPKDRRATKIVIIY